MCSSDLFPSHDTTTTSNMENMHNTTNNNTTGIATFGNQSSVNTANALQMMSGLLSNIANAGSQASAKKYNSAEAAAERAFQKEMRGTAYQDTVKDMIAAGINPILAATNGAGM